MVTNLTDRTPIRCVGGANGLCHSAALNSKPMSARKSRVNTGRTNQSKPSNGNQTAENIRKVVSRSGSSPSLTRSGRTIAELSQPRSVRSSSSRSSSSSFSSSRSGSSISSFATTASGYSVDSTRTTARRQKALGTDLMGRIRNKVAEVRSRVEWYI